MVECHKTTGLSKNFQKCIIPIPGIKDFFPGIFFQKKNYLTVDCSTVYILCLKKKYYNSIATATV